MDTQLEDQRLTVCAANLVCLMAFAQLFGMPPMPRTSNIPMKLSSRLWETSQLRNI